MRTRVAFGLAAFVLPAALAGCGLFNFETRPPWRDQAEARCLATHPLQPSAFLQPRPEISSPGICGLVHPFRVGGLAEGGVLLGPHATLGCPMIVATEAWVRDVVQPAALAYFGEEVVELKILASYGCRTRDNIRGAKLSEHAFGNALDVGGFKLASGREISVLKGWRGEADEQAFLHATHAGACTYFTTVLGPGSDSFHTNHFHLDLAHHDARGLKHYCRPKPVAPADVPMAFAPSAPLRTGLRVPEPAEPAEPAGEIPSDD
jgi:hypothetical protein